MAPMWALTRGLDGSDGSHASVVVVVGGGGGEKKGRMVTICDVHDISVKVQKSDQTED